MIAEITVVVLVVGIIAVLVWLVATTTAEDSRDIRRHSGYSPDPDQCPSTPPPPPKNAGSAVTYRVGGYAKGGLDVRVEIDYDQAGRPWLRSTIQKS